MTELASNITRREAINIIAGTAVAPHLFGAEQQNTNRRPWYAQMRRCGQTNFNERDPIELRMDWWIEYLKQLKLKEQWQHIAAACEDIACLEHEGGHMIKEMTDVGAVQRVKAVRWDVARNVLWA